MAVQGGDKLVASRVGINGSVTANEIAELPTPLNTHTDVNITPSSNPKEVLKNNGSDIYENSTLESNDLDDFDTTLVTPEIGWIHKYDGTNFVPCLRKVIRSSDISITQTDQNNPKVKFDVPINIQRVGTYSFDLKTSGSMNTTTTDLVGVLYFDNNPLAVVTGNEMFKIEFKDSAGNNNDGRGTDQKGNLGNRLYYQANSIGIFNVRFEFYGSTTDDSASVFDCSCVVEEEFGIIDNNLT